MVLLCNTKFFLAWPDLVQVEGRGQNGADHCDYDRAHLITGHLNRLPLTRGFISIAWLSWKSYLISSCSFSRWACVLYTSLHIVSTLNHDCSSQLKIYDLNIALHTDWLSFWSGISWCHNMPERMTPGMPVALFLSFLSLTVNNIPCNITLLRRCRENRYIVM